MLLHVAIDGLIFDLLTVSIGPGEAEIDRVIEDLTRRLVVTGGRPD